MTELFNPRPVHDGRESGSSQSRDRMSLDHALLSFQRPLRRVRRVSSPRPLGSGTKKAPRLRGPVMRPAEVSADLGSSYEAAPFVIRSKSDRAV